jgi:hypothetical protein
MNIVNRFLVILADLLLLAGALLVLLITFGAVTPQQVLPAVISNSLLGQWLASFAGLDANSRLITALVALLILVLGLVLLFFELRPAPRVDTLRIRDDSLGAVTVRTASVYDLIQHTAAQMPDVLQVHPQIEMRQQVVHIRCRAALTHDASIPQVSAELQERIKRAVEHHLGMKVAGVAIQAQLEPLSEVVTRPRQARRQLR